MGGTLRGPRGPKNMDCFEYFEHFAFVFVCFCLCLCICLCVSLSLSLSLLVSPYGQPDRKIFTVLHLLRRGLQN